MHKFAVIGNPVAHSRSPDIHQRFALEFGLSIEYEKVLGSLTDFTATVNELLDQGISGFNVTVPFKKEAWRLCKSVSDAADLVQAVNTVSVRSDGLVGDNTDGVGLIRDIIDNLKWEVAGKRVLLIGAGGAAKGVTPALLSEDPKQVVICNRTHSRAETMVAELQSDRLVAVQSEYLIEPFDLVINCTSAGLYGEVPQVPVDIFDSSTRCYDMIYGAETTHFNRWASEHGVPLSADGLGMLVEQAAAAFSIWTGQHPSTRPVIQGLREGLQRGLS